MYTNQMATGLIPFRSIAVQACSAEGHRKPDANRRLNSSPNWWAPIFGWSSDSVYIDSDNRSTADLSAKVETKSRSDLDPRPARSRFGPGCFTKEKARQLRMMTTNTSSFHDVMYHSAIASRLASDFSSPFDR